MNIRPIPQLMAIAAPQRLFGTTGVFAFQARKALG